eukprot:scaffold31004_cov50-Cyclotella_meneghiniana.AAC.1
MSGRVTGPHQLWGLVFSIPLASRFFHYGCCIKPRKLEGPDQSSIQPLYAMMRDDYGMRIKTALCVAKSQAIHRKFINNIERVVVMVMVSIKKFDKRRWAQPT